MKKIIKRQQNRIPAPARRRPAYQSRLRRPPQSHVIQSWTIRAQCSVSASLNIIELCVITSSVISLRLSSAGLRVSTDLQLCVWCRRRAWSLQVQCVTQWKRHILVSASLQPMCSWTSWYILFATCGKTTSECINRFIFDFNCQWTICEKSLLFNLYDR